MRYLLTLLICGTPFAMFIFRGIDIWHAQGLWFQIGTLLCFSYSFFEQSRNDVKRNVPVALLTFWLGCMTALSFYLGLKIGVINMISLPTFFNLLTMVIFYRLCVEYLTPVDVTRILKLLVWVVIITMGFCVLQYYGLSQWLKPITEGLLIQTKGRHPVVGFIGNPTHLSAYLGMMLPVLFMKSRRFAVISVGLLFTIICCTTSYIFKEVPVTGIVVALSTLLLYTVKREKIMFFFILSILFFTALFCYDKISGKTFGDNGRFGMYQTKFTESKDKFVTGVGLGITRLKAIQTKDPNKHFHNEYLQSLNETGIIGLLIILYIIWGYLKIPTYDKEGVIMKCVFIGFLLQSFTLYPAHLWLVSSTATFVYAGNIIKQGEQI
jgi:O-antigen ligase